MNNVRFILIIVIRISKYWLWIVQQSMKLQLLDIHTGLEGSGDYNLEGSVCTNSQDSWIKPLMSMQPSREDGIPPFPHMAPNLRVIL